MLQRIAIEQLAPETAARCTDSVIVSRNRREIADDRNLFAALGRFTQKADHAPIRVVRVDPFEAGWIAIELAQRRFVPIGFVQRAQPATERAALRVFLQVPGQLGVVVPFLPVREFACP